ncbi:MAG: fumarylacetoacetate hydrolase family protein [Anaerolineae bacterium]|nr:fumarylacetoacetate hydrolase family protein [Anaerolineae bacterium]
MKLVTFLKGGKARLGALLPPEHGEAVVDLNQAEPRLPADLVAFLAAGAEARSLAEEVIAAPPPEAVLRSDGVTLKAPILRPGKIICIGLNYRDHAAEAGVPVPDYPAVFAKYSNTVIGPGEPIVLPRISQQVDYEAELGVVIGRRAKGIAEADAVGYVAGYLAFNDVSARDFQNKTSQWTIGKTFDSFAPMGPALVTADEIPDPHRLSIRLSIGGEVLQSSNTCNLVFGVPRLVACLSAVMSLEPGDVIATGTPGGVGFARKPPRWLRPGDVVRVEIEGVGMLENPVIAEPVA